MRNSKNIFIVLSVIVSVVALGEGVYIARTRNVPMQNIAPSKDLRVATTSMTTPCPPRMAPDGSMVPVCEAVLVAPSPSPSPYPGVVQIDAPTGIPTSVLDINKNQSFLATSGTGTTTLKKDTPFNDILVAETGSPYASMRNARYTVWPYPGDIALKEVYVVLPDAYDPIFSGYSNKQLIEFDGTKNLMLYLRLKQSTGTGADARIFIQAPTPSNEQDHGLKFFDSTDSWAGFSIVSKGQEVVVEIILSPSLDFSPGLKATVYKELTHAVEDMEIVW